MADGVEHLQSAAREMIAAARTFLDVVEEVVGDNVAVASVADALGSFGQVVSRGGQPGRRTPTAPTGRRSRATRGPPVRVQHIDLS